MKTVYNDLQEIIRSYSGASDDRLGHTIVRLDKKTGRAVEPRLFSVEGLLYDLLRVVVVPDHLIWVSGQSDEVGNFDTNEIVTLPYRLEVLIPAGSETKAAEGLVGRGDKKPVETLRQAIRDWLDDWFRSHPDDRSRIRHRIADALLEVEFAVSAAMSREFHMLVKLKFELDSTSTTPRVRLAPPDFGGLTVSTEDARELSLPMPLTIDLTRNTAHAGGASVHPPENSAGWVSVLSPIIRNVVATQVRLHDYFFDAGKVEHILLGAVGAEARLRGFTCDALQIAVSGLKPPPFRSVGNSITIPAPPSGYNTADPTFSAKFDTIVLWRVSNIGAITPYLYPENHLLAELMSGVERAAGKTMRGVPPELYLGHFESQPISNQSDINGRTALPAQVTPPGVSDLLKASVRDELAAKLGPALVVEQIDFLQKDEEFSLLIKLIRDLPDSAVRLELDVINARGITQHVDAVFHVSGISRINPMKVRKGIDPASLRRDMGDWSKECLKNMDLPDIARIDVHERNKAFTSDARQRLEAFVAMKAVEFYGIVVVLKSVNRLVTPIDEMFEPLFAIVEEKIRLARDAPPSVRAKLLESGLLGVKQSLISRHLDAIRDQREGHLDGGAITILNNDIRRIIGQADKLALADATPTDSSDDL